jgi:type IV secretory pathway TraG/TraD family ATPase VirD4
VGRFGDALKRQVNSIRDDVRQAKGEAPAGPSGRVAQRQQQDDWLIVRDLARESDPYPWLLSIHAGHRHMHHQLVMGTDGRGDFIYTDERRNLLMLGPPRSDKTAGVLIPLIISAPGPVVSTSTKDDVLRATGLARARLGTVWHFGPDGSAAPPGTRPLRWSPIPSSRDWTTAQGLAKAITDSSRKTGDRGGGDNSAFFANRAAAFIAAVFHAAAIADRPMQWVLRATAGNEKVVREAVDILNDAIGSDASLAADSLQGIVEQDSRARSGIYATAEVALSVYRLPGALKTTEDPNFDPAEFVAGRPDTTNIHRSVWIDERTPSNVVGQMQTYQEWGSYDTVYITASGTQQSLVAPLVAGLLTQIREAVYAQHRVDEAQGNYARPPVVWALDELASLPMQDIPETLSQSGGQGLLVAACLQDLGLVERKWDVHPETFLTLFGDIVVHPGIRDTKTLEAVSTILGKHWVTVSSTSSNQGYTRGRDSSRQEGWQQSTSQQLLPVLEPSVISRGLGDHPDRVLHLRGKSWNWAFSMPYWKAPPWPQLLVGTMGYAGEQKVIESRWELPPPELDRAGDGQALLHAGGPQLQIRHHRALQGLDGFRSRRRQHLAQRQQYPLLRDHDDTKVVEPMNVEMWLLSPQPVQREEFDRLAAKWGWAVNTDPNEWLSFTDPQDGSRAVAQVDWLMQMDRMKVQLRWQDPAVGDAIVLSGWRWSDCWLLDQYARAKGLPGLMLQGWARSSAGFEVLYSFGMKLAEEMPIGIVMNEQTFHAAGDWEPYGGAPEFDDSALPAAPEPVPEPSRTFHIGEQGYKEMTFTAADFADDGDADRKIENLLRATGNLRPEDYR